MADMISGGFDLASAAIANISERHRLTESQKLIVVNLINERKDVLFGKRSPAAKKIAWNAIIDECRLVYQFHAIAPDKDWQHIRNHVWSDMKQAVVKKLRDGITEFTELDAAILEVLGEQDRPITVYTRSDTQQSKSDDARSRLAPEKKSIATGDVIRNDNAEGNVIREQPRPAPLRRLIPARHRRPFASLRRRGLRPGEINEPLPHISRLRLSIQNHSEISNRSSIVRPPQQGAVGRLLRTATRKIPIPTYLSPFYYPPKRPRGSSDDEDEDDQDQEVINLRKQLMTEKIKHYSLLNEKLKLEIEAMRQEAP